MNIHDRSRVLRDAEGRKVGQMSPLPKLLFLQLVRKSFFAERELCRGELSAFCWIPFLNFLVFIFFRVRLQELKRKGKKKRGAEAIDYIKGYPFENTIFL